MVIFESFSEKSIPMSKVEHTKRQRSKSMFIDQTYQPIEQTAEQPIKTPNNVRFTLDDFHLEFLNKYASWNHGLHPTNNRQLAEPLQNSVFKWEKLFDEFQAKRKAKQAKNAQEKTVILIQRMISNKPQAIAE